mgnify:CR=1 FL=1
MKKFIVLLLVLIMPLTLAACGGNSGGKSPSESSAPAESGNAPSGEARVSKYYGIGEAAEADGFSITIDKAEAPNPDLLLNSAKEGHKFLQVHFTFKNISNETVETPKNKAICIVYEEGETGDSSDMTADDGSHFLPGKEKEEMYRGYVELAPGESVSGWMLYQRLADQEEVTMHYYSGYVNVPPDLMFRFTAE